MPSKIILSVLRISVSILFYLLIILTLIFTVASTLNITGKVYAKKLTGRTFGYKALAVGVPYEEIPFTVSADSIVRYRPVQNEYSIGIAPNSVFGYYAFLSKLIFLLLGIAILWNFKKIFKETNLDHPFKVTITRHLKILAALFIISDVLKFIDYLLFNKLLHQYVDSPQFQLLTDLGNGIITGLIIFIISIIYQRGTALQDETSLTV